eukprot:TRINITY_DN1581_c0_g3_i1.p1 TRINITY_DN1581_c0_g3~~TRINITY_DN1581_c0_g3_i1.p1  ORF type:complete len:442 (-),score=89.36 TRINITY_DN1581_c0_g3_i1:78-1403(-)
MTTFILLFLTPFALSQSSVVVLLTPSPYFNHRLVPHANISRYGMRQAYLIGQELQTLYSAKPLTQIFSDSSLPSAQTALALSKGIHLAGFGPLIEDRKLQLKAVPPIASHNFTNWSEQMRDQALPHYSALGFANSLVNDEDKFFHAEKNCASVQNMLYANKINCSESEVGKAACKELGNVCNISITRAYDACDCLDTYKSARFHGLTKEVNKNLVDYMEKKCEEHEKNLLKDKRVTDVQKLLTEKLFDKFESNLNSTSNFNLYVISELQMKAAIYALTFEFPSKMPKYGSMLVLERTFTSEGNSNISLSFNKQPQKILNSTSIPYGKFLAWISSQRLDDYEYMCTPYSRPSTPSRKWLWIIVGVASGLSLAAIIALIVIIRVTKKKISEDALSDDDYYYMSGAPNASLPINESTEPKGGRGAKSREATLNPTGLLEEDKTF